jgi:hypothetical protein
MPSGTHVASNVTKAMIASTDQDIVPAGLCRSVVNQQRARHPAQIMYVKLRFCEKHGAVQRGAGAFCDFVMILYCDSGLRFCSRLLIGCIAICDSVKEQDKSSCARPRLRFCIIGYLLEPAYTAHRRDGIQQADRSRARVFAIVYERG